MDRAVVLETVFNMRDVGGIVTRSGEEVRRGRVFRSDALSALSDPDVTALRGYDMRTIIDLRTSFELDRQGPTCLIEQGLRHCHIPMLEGNLDAQGIRRRPDTMAELYATMLDLEAENFADIFRLLADDANLPAVIHCTAGKDRTGVTVAMLYDLLGVDGDLIVEDYAITDGNMAAMMAFTETLGRRVGHGAPAHFIRAEAATMQAFLTDLHERHGGAATYLTSAGLEQHAVDAIRASMLATTSPDSATP